jgi:hypothetical protein
MNSERADVVRRSDGRLQKTAYSSPSIIMIKSRRMRWEGYIAREGEKRNGYRILVGKPRRKETIRKTKKAGGQY